jgi:hypothetical protein
MGEPDGLLHLWECARVLRLPGGNPDFKRCGFIATATPGGQAGFCPYDHGENVTLVPIKALVLCSDCEEPIMRDDARAPDGRLICSQCAMSYIGEYDDDDDEPHA